MAGMWYLISCIAGGYSTCTPPVEMPTLEVCQTVGAQLRKAMIGGGKRVICVNGQTGETINVKEP